MPLFWKRTLRQAKDLALHRLHDPVDHAFHEHGPICGHWSVEHENHLDYLHEGHAHHKHHGHWDECPPTAEMFAQAIEPQQVAITARSGEADGERRAAG